MSIPTPTLENQVITSEEEALLIQKGTGLHLDSWPYNLWKKLKSDMSYEELDRFRPFQSMVCLTDGDSDRNKKEGGLEIVPGFASVAEKYFPAMDQLIRNGNGFRVKSPWISSYHIRFNQEEDKPLFELVRKVQRIPQDWKIPEASSELTQLETADEMLNYMKKIVNEHDSLEYVPIKKGDFILFDNRTAHQNSSANHMDRPRSVFYHAYSCEHQVNRNTIEKLREKRKTFEHPDDFGTKFRVEQVHLKPETDLVPLTTLGECLYNEKSYERILENEDNPISQILKENDHFLTQKHIDFFHRYGYVVVENCVPDQDCDQLLDELFHYSSLAGCPISLDSRSVSQDQFSNIGGGFGAMVEFYYLPMQQKMRMNPALYTSTVKLLSNTWCAKTPNIWNVPYQCPFEVDPRKLWLYIDRMNFRLPNQ